ncbi:protein of unknown function [Palleronia marisminoris]|uniref:YjiS-like domain-containing protein n=1 Tax=Palleronia marisminoris TaxID=315423 RepID=A0A1Y5RIW0_9RHOB|nr:DUF1127 domain-containing protein [Palleronia marisminoris]SFG23479.1 protein of unknown function [Palleronia marisminoris]SLN18385.1 hypothetical protein PAM7066_00598 [Palleronia marisminoris]
MAALTSRVGRSLVRRSRYGTDLLAWWGLYLQRRQLRTLDDRLLEDIGRSRAEADAEAGRPVWDAPSHWRK